MKAIIVAALVGLVLVGCGREPDTQLVEQTPMQSKGRVSVTRVGVFTDNLAYANRRGIYIIKDEQTGQEFIGVSGIGITEVGSHAAGKVRVEHEE